MRRFTFAEGSSKKFWEVDVDGRTLTVRFGRLGTAGQSKVKKLASPAAAETELQKLVREKTNKGYVEECAASAKSKPAKVAAPKSKPAKAAKAPAAKTAASKAPKSKPGKAPVLKLVPARSCDTPVPSDADRAKFGEEDHVVLGASGRVAALVRQNDAYQKLAFLEGGKKRLVSLPDSLLNLGALAVRPDGTALAAAADEQHLYEVSIPKGEVRKLWETRPYAEGQIRGTAYAPGDRLVVLTDKKVCLMRRDKSGLEVVTSTPAAEGWAIDAYLGGELLLVSSYSKRAQTQVFGLAGDELRLLASFKDELYDAYESGGRIFGISGADDKPKELTGYVRLQPSPAAPPKAPAANPTAAAKIAEEFLEDFFSREEFDEDGEPLVWFQYAGPRKAGPGIAICFGVRSGRYADDGDVQQLAQKALAALDRKHAEVGEVYVEFSEM
jgi:predicted DNA-binding WGR domain protein